MFENNAAGAVNLIQDAGFDEAAFARLPNLLTNLVGARSCAMQFVDRQWSQFDFAWNYFPAELISDYVANFMPDDLWLQAARRMSPNTAWVMDQFVPYDERLGSRIYNELCRPYGDDTTYSLSSLVATPHGYLSLSIHRGPRAGAFSAEDAAAVQTLLPHLGRLHSLRHRLTTAEARSDLMKGALDGFGFAVLMVHADRRIATLNAQAEAVLNRRDGLRLVKGRLTATEPHLDSRLAAMLHNATGSDQPVADAMLLPRPDDLPAWRLTATPVANQGVAMVVIEAADMSRDTAGLARRLYGLTPSEASLAEALLRGDRPEDFADQRGVRMTTVRSQLSSLLAKTGTERQSQMVAHLASLPATRRHN